MHHCHNIAANRVPSEVHHFLHAVEQEKKDLREIRGRLYAAAQPDDADIFQAHIMMLEDSVMVERIRSHIATRQINAEAAVAQVSNEFTDVFSQAENPYLRE